MAVGRGRTEEAKAVRGRQADMGGLLPTRGHGAIQALGCRQGPYLGPWYQWSTLPPKATRMPNVWAAACGHVDIQGLLIWVA